MLGHAAGLLILLLLWPIGLLAEDYRGRVEWIYDGDTLLVSRLGKVRLLGIDVPETRASPRDLFYHKNFSIPASRLRQVAQRAKRFLIKHVKGRTVQLATEEMERDRHGRLLAYVELPGGRQLNRLLLAEGLASTFRRYDFSQKTEFMSIEAMAREQALGLWKK